MSRANDTVVVTNKKELFKWLDTIPDDAIIIHPVWGLHGQVKCPTKKYPNPSIDVRLDLAKELIKDSERDIKNLYNINFTPIMWVMPEKIEKVITEEGLKLFKESKSLSVEKVGETKGVDG